MAAAALTRKKMSGTDHLRPSLTAPPHYHPPTSNQQAFDATAAHTALETDGNASAFEQAPTPSASSQSIDDADFAHFFTLSKLAVVPFGTALESGAASTPTQHALGTAGVIPQAQGAGLRVAYVAAFGAGAGNGSSWWQQRVSCRASTQPQGRLGRCGRARRPPRFFSSCRALRSGLCWWYFSRPWRSELIMLDVDRSAEQQETLKEMLQEPKNSLVYLALQVGDEKTHKHIVCAHQLGEAALLYEQDAGAKPADK